MPLLRSSLRFSLDWITMDMSASRTDVASSIEVSDSFTLEPLSFDVMAATDYIDNCVPRAPSLEDLCGILDEILFTLEDVDAEAQITPERLRASQFGSMGSIEMLHADLFDSKMREFKNTSGRLSFLAAPPLQPHRFAAEAASSVKRQPASPQKDVPSKKQAKSGESSHALPPPLAISKTRLLWRKGNRQPKRAPVELNSAKAAKSVIAQSSPATKAAESASAPEPSKKDDGYTTVGRNGKRIAPIVIDAQSNATELPYTDRELV
ncbi:hypothetical protein TNCV_5087801 [Trichonephila clavipes]|nr:hypothetical protein TNCV_5087801 [Trichonephila clavipes]